MFGADDVDHARLHKGEVVAVALVGSEQVEHILLGERGEHEAVFDLVVSVERAEEYFKFGVGKLGESLPFADGVLRAFGKLFGALLYGLFALLFAEPFGVGGPPREGEGGRALVGVDEPRLKAVVGGGLGDGRRQRLRMMDGAGVSLAVRLRRRPMDGDGARVRLAAHRAAEAAFKEEGASLRRARKEKDGGDVGIAVGLVAVLAAEEIEPFHIELFVEREIGHRL